MITDHLTLLTDLYELTMMQGYFKTGNQNVVIFDAFYRTNPDNGGYAIFAGLAQIIDYIERLRFDASDISYLRSLGIFEEDFLEYLRTFRRYLRRHGRHSHFPPGTLDKSNRPHYGSTAYRNSHIEYLKPPEPDCHKGRARLLCCRQ